jgi:N-methylhydantoinase B
VGGGRAGGRSRFVVRLGTPEEHDTRASGRYEMKAGERFSLQSAAGGGFGDPRQRERAALERDVAEGYVTVEAAHKDYGSAE